MGAVQLCSLGARSARDLTEWDLCDWRLIATSISGSEILCPHQRVKPGTG